MVPHSAVIWHEIMYARDVFIWIYLTLNSQIYVEIQIDMSLATELRTFWSTPFNVLYPF